MRMLTPVEIEEGYPTPMGPRNEAQTAAMKVLAAKQKARWQLTSRSAGSSRDQTLPGNLLAESSRDSQWAPCPIIQEKLRLWWEIEVEQNRGFQKAVKRHGPPQGYAHWHRPYRWGLNGLPNPDPPYADLPPQWNGMRWEHDGQDWVEVPDDPRHRFERPFRPWQTQWSRGDVRWVPGEPWVIQSKRIAGKSFVREDGIIYTHPHPFDHSGEPYNGKGAANSIVSELASSVGRRIPYARWAGTARRASRSVNQSKQVRASSAAG